MIDKRNFCTKKSFDKKSINSQFFFWNNQKQNHVLALENNAKQTVRGHVSNMMQDFYFWNRLPDKNFSNEWNYCFHAWGQKMKVTHTHTYTPKFREFYLPVYYNHHHVRRSINHCVCKSSTVSHYHTITPGREKNAF